jgi:hypothetical protein
MSDLIWSLCDIELCTIIGNFIMLILDPCFRLC